MNSCPRCKTELPTRAPIWRIVIGFSLVVIGVVLFLITFSASFILSVYGVFLMLPDRECKACGYKK
ncbi:hypothetical protein FRD01_17420 [Microvenator marinus]|uniref:LITAF domain-containing protein n=1 Tax=Microvenator marinus TaxID=2600177 RepID=A0A5B8XZ92_9DELT|nr:hypothetical protein [Microvenator marinus]QED28986.1 hypothetical protein FRD01_17420 [Microvenator marinus]